MFMYQWHGVYTFKNKSGLITFNYKYTNKVKQLFTCSIQGQVHCTGTDTS